MVGSKRWRWLSAGAAGWCEEWGSLISEGDGDTCSSASGPCRALPTNQPAIHQLHQLHQQCVLQCNQPGALVRWHIPIYHTKSTQNYYNTGPNWITLALMAHTASLQSAFFPWCNKQHQSALPVHTECTAPFLRENTSWEYQFLRQPPVQMCKNWQSLTIHNTWCGPYSKV